MRLFLVLFFLSAGYAFAQLPLTEEEFLARLTTGNTFPETLLKSRSVVFYPHTMTEKEMQTIQLSFQRTGIDAVVYHEDDLLIAGRDVSMELAQYLIHREIKNIILFRKKDYQWSAYIFAFNAKANFVDDKATAWYDENRLEDILRRIYRESANSGMKKENLLINEVPETGFNLNPINGKRNEFYAIDLKVDMLAVPKFNDEQLDKELEEIMKSLYPLKYTLTDPNTTEADLRKQGNLFVLRFVKARAKVAKKVLGYDMTKSESAIVSIAYTSEQPQLKTIPADEIVYKFYFKHIESGNVYLGNKWDADETWQQALINQLKGFKIEFKIN